MPPSTDTRDRIIDSAMEMFVYHGFEQTGLAQIAKKANALPGSIYHYFPTKEDLLRATLEKRLVRLWPDLLDPIWDRIDDPIERIFGLMDGYRQMLIVTEFSHGCPIGNLALELAETHPRIRELLAKNFDNWLRAVRECFEQAADRLPPDSEPQQLAVFVLTTMEGAVMLARTYRNLNAYDTAIGALRDYIDRMVRDERHWSAPSQRPAGPDGTSKIDSKEKHA